MKERPRRLSALIDSDTWGSVLRLRMSVGPAGEGGREGRREKGGRGRRREGRREEDEGGKGEGCLRGGCVCWFDRLFGLPGVNVVKSWGTGAGTW